MMISPAQCRAARGLLGWSQDQLVAATGGNVSKRTLARIELEDGAPRQSTLAAIRTALEAAGVEFIDDGGPGVRLREKAA